jgi:hypothetical protein
MSSFGSGIATRIRVTEDLLVVMPVMSTVLVFDRLILATVAVCRRTVVFLVMAGIRIWVDGVVLLVVVAVVILWRAVDVEGHGSGETHAEWG